MPESLGWLRTEWTWCKIVLVVISAKKWKHFDKVSFDIISALFSIFQPSGLKIFAWHFVHFISWLWIPQQAARITHPHTHLLVLCKQPLIRKNRKTDRAFQHEAHHTSTRIPRQRRRIPPSSSSSADRWRITCTRAMKLMFFSCADKCD